VHAEDPAPLDAGCACPACRQFSRAYLHYVVKAGEIIASMLLTWHNLAYYQNMMADLRAAIAGGTSRACAEAIFAAYPRKNAARDDAAGDA